MEFGFSILHNTFISARISQDNRHQTIPHLNKYNFFNIWTSAEITVRILLNYFLYVYSTKRDLASHFSFPAFAALQQTLKSFSIIIFFPFNRFCFLSCFHLILKLFMYYSVSWQLAWSVDWHLRVDGQPPSAVSIARDKCDEQWGRERSRPVIDTGATARGQSHASKNGAIDSPAL